MADRTLIDRYLGELRREIRWVRNAEDILEEVADHLLEAVATFTRRGLDRRSAEQRALTEFGDPTLVGRAFASSTTGGIAVPTTFTRRAGVALMASSLFWLTGIALIYFAHVADRTRPWEELPQTLWTIGAISLLAAGGLLVIGVLGVNRRHGGAFGLSGRIVLWLAVLTAVASFAAWAWGSWLTTLGVGALLLAATLAGSDIAPRPPGWLIGAGGALAAGSAWLFEIALADEIELGSGAVTAFIFAGLAIYSVGLLLLGSWRHAYLCPRWEDDLAFPPGVGMQHQRHVATRPPEQAFEPSVVVGMSVREDDRPKVTGVDLQDVEIVGGSALRQPGVIQDPVGAPVAVNLHRQGVPVLSAQLIPFAPLPSPGRPHRHVRGCREDVDRVVHHHRDLDRIHRLELDRLSHTPPPRPAANLALGYSGRRAAGGAAPAPSRMAQDRPQNENRVTSVGKSNHAIAL